MKAYLIIFFIIMLCLLLLPTLLSMNNADASPEMASYGIISSALVTLFVVLFTQTKSIRKMLTVWSISILCFIILANSGLALAFWTKDYAIKMQFLLMINSGIVIVAIFLGIFGLIIQRYKRSAM